MSDYATFIRARQAPVHSTSWKYDSKEKGIPLSFVSASVVKMQQWACQLTGPKFRVGLAASR